MELEIKKLTMDSLEDWLEYFDNDALADDLQQRDLPLPAQPRAALRRHGQPLQRDRDGLLHGRDAVLADADLQILDPIQNTAPAGHAGSSVFSGRVDDHIEGVQHLREQFREVFAGVREHCGDIYIDTVAEYHFADAADRERDKFGAGKAGCRRGSLMYQNRRGKKDAGAMEPGIFTVIALPGHCPMSAFVFCTVRLLSRLIVSTLTAASAIIRLIIGMIMAINDFTLLNNVIIIDIVYVYDVVLVNNVMLVFNDMLMLYHSLDFSATVFLLYNWLTTILRLVNIFRIYTHRFPPLWVLQKLGGKFVATDLQ